MTSSNGGSGAERGSSFYLGFLFLSRERREALNAVYAYCRLIDDIVDSGTLPREEAEGLLAFWGEEIDRLYAGEAAHPVAKALAAPVTAFALPKEAFLEIIRGCRMDLGEVRYATFEELESYFKGVACAAGTLSAEIFGHSHTPPERLREFCRMFGYAFQLTNILRDVGTDLEMGRVYIPEADMAEAGYSRESLERRKRDGGFSKLMRLEYDRAKGFYRSARAALDPRDRRAMLPAEIMAHVYEGLLDQLRKDDFPVFGPPLRTPRWKKALAAGRAWLYCRGASS